MDEVVAAMDGSFPQCDAHNPEAAAACRRELLVKRFIDEGKQEPANVTCNPERRLGFAVKAQAYYWQGITHLRDGLYKPDSKTFQAAAVCLRQAFASWGGKNPSCDKRIHGMWTDDYMPYIALAVIKAEREAKEKR
jgi:hypothetical protein